MKVVAKQIEMIAYFKEDGEIEPIKFRMDMDNKSITKVIKISKIIDSKLEKFCGNKMKVFTCSGIVDNEERIFEIKFDIEKCTWMLFKI